uniref:Uncharacterized protein n=1 Tax=Oryza punctata TaxID=4537 RepID=A0A0E0MEF3_ORYPU
MDENGFYTNLMNGGDSSYDRSDVGTQPEFPEQQNVEGDVCARPNQKSSKNFSMQEDVLLVSAWINISIDAI